MEQSIDHQLASQLCYVAKAGKPSKGNNCDLWPA